MNCSICNDSGFDFRGQVCDCAIALQVDAEKMFEVLDFVTDGSIFGEILTITGNGIVYLITTDGDVIKRDESALRLATMYEFYETKHLNELEEAMYV